MYDLNLKGPIGLVIGSKGEGVGSLVRKLRYDGVDPMKGISIPLNASVAQGCWLMRLSGREGK